MRRRFDPSVAYWKWRKIYLASKNTKKRNADKRDVAAEPKPGKGGWKLQPYAPDDADIITNYIITNHVTLFLNLKLNDAPVLSNQTLLDHFSRQKRCMFFLVGISPRLRSELWQKLYNYYYAEICQLHPLCTISSIAILTVLFGVGGSGRILSRMGWRPFLIAKVSVNSGRTDKEWNKYAVCE